MSARVVAGLSDALGRMLMTYPMPLRLLMLGWVAAIPAALVWMLP